MNNGIEKLQKYAFGMNPRRCDDILLLADQIKREHVSELQAIEERYTHWMEWPRFEDGERVEFGSAVDGLDSPCEKFIFTRSMGGVCQLQDACGNMVNVLHGERVKRPGTEVLGADGLPIKVGETVYLISGSEPYIVESLPKREDGMLRLDGLESQRVKTYCYYPGNLTNTHHDTQERIDDDATMYPDEYCKKHGIQAGTPDNAPFVLSDFVEPMALDILRRQRELDAKTMGGAE